MAYLVSTRANTWEIRESRTTTAGPRSRTLATFRILTPEVIERACERSAKSLEADDLRAGALRAGAPVEIPAADRAARDLLVELEAGTRPPAVLRRLLVDAVAADRIEISDNIQSAAQWLGANPERRAAALLDLLLLTDKLPVRRRSNLRFPRIESTPP